MSTQVPPDARPSRKPFPRGYFRGEGASRMPFREDMRAPNAIADFILKGWMPQAPFITRDMDIVAFGSCFATNIGRYLASAGFNIATERQGIAYVQRLSDGLPTAHRRSTSSATATSWGAPRTSEISDAISGTAAMREAIAERRPAS